MSHASPRCACADACLADGYEAVLGGERADLLLTDPPYCLLTRRRKGGDPRDPKHRKIERGPLARFEDVGLFRRFTERWLARAVPHLKLGAPLVVWTNPLGKAPLAAAARSQGYSVLAGELVWAKRTTDRTGGEQLLRVYETALVFLTEPRPPPAAADPPACWSVVAGYDDDGEAARWGSHPSHKPFGVLEPLVRTWSRPGQLVLDPFAGSGSVPAAALRLGRRAACLEKEPDWAGRVGRRLAIALETSGP